MVGPKGMEKKCLTPVSVYFVFTKTDAIKRMHRICNQKPMIRVN